MLHELEPYPGLVLYEGSSLDVVQLNRFYCHWDAAAAACNILDQPNNTYFVSGLRWMIIITE